MNDKKVTELDREIVQQLADGLTVAELADKSELGKSAMESKILRMRLKCGCKSIAALCVHFYRNGWIE